MLSRRHHRLGHEGGFGVERSAGGTTRFNRLLDTIQGKDNPPVEATERVIPC